MPYTLALDRGLWGIGVGHSLILDGEITSYLVGRGWTDQPLPVLLKSKVATCSVGQRNGYFVDRK